MNNARETEFSSDFSEVKEFYSQLRVMLYKRMKPKYTQFNFTPISFDDCLTADLWQKIEPDKRSSWRWQDAFSGYRKAFKRFDMAVKQGGKLVSLTYGVPTTHKTGLKIDLIESTPFRKDKLGVKAFEVISYAAQVYAVMLGAHEIRIMRPTSVENREHYCSFGYDYVSNDHKPSLPDYCVIKLR